jgi:hypothetical protein
MERLPQPVMTVEKFSFDKGDLLLQRCSRLNFLGSIQRSYLGAGWSAKEFATEAEEKI